MMKVLVMPLLSLFIAHLTVGGELLQYSADTIQVSADGRDDSSCLNGSSHCKTLGYVLTNIPMLQCSSCTVMVLYDHSVGPLNSSTPYRVNISNVEVLYIVGSMRQRSSIYFNGSGIELVNASSAKSFIIENIAIYDCNFTGTVDQLETIASAGGCISTDGHLSNFTMTNVSLRNAGPICVTAKDAYFHNSCFVNAGGIYLKVPGSTSTESMIKVSGCTFENISASNAIDMLLEYPPDPALKILAHIKHCNFKNISSKSAAVQIHICKSSYDIDLVVEGCSFTNSNNSLIAVGMNNDISLVYGQVVVANNYIEKNTCHGNGCISGIFQKEIYMCLDHFEMLCTGNTFIHNYGTIMKFENWPGEFIMIKNSTIIDNRASNRIVQIFRVATHNGVCPKVAVLSDLNFTSNNITTFSVTAQENAIVIVKNYILSIAYASFTKNQGTPLSLVGVYFITSFNNLRFYGNTAIIGGGIYIMGGNSSFPHHDLLAGIIGNISFVNNSARYGGAMYIDQEYCSISTPQPVDNNSITFSTNSATRYGSSIFSAYDWCSLCWSNIIDTDSITSIPTYMSFNNDNMISVYPGQTIVGNMTVTDCLGNPSFCPADAYILCGGGKFCDNNMYYLKGPSLILVQNGFFNTELKFIDKSGTNLKVNVTLQLMLACKISKPILLKVNITLSPCPLGLVYDPNTGQCECVEHNNFVCLRNATSDIICIRRGYVYSNHSSTVSRCPFYAFCKYSGPACSFSTYTDSADYVLLGSCEDDQCLYGHGGTLCTGCAHNKQHVPLVPTYGVLQCIDSDRCAHWHPYVLLLFNFLIPFIYGAFLIVVVRPRLNIGSGYMYGPLFYVAVLNLMPLSSSYGVLNTIASLFVATYLVKLDVLGYLPWCFFKPINLLTSQWFRLIAPSVVVVILLLTVQVARRSPKLLGHIQPSPLQAMCVLMVVLFWSLANTAISVVTPVFLSGVEGPRVLLQPDLAYLSGGHIPLWIISVIILLVLSSIVIMLLFSRFLRLHRFKPVLDEFQSCYKDNYRWYGGVYFVVWGVLQALVILLPDYQMFRAAIIVLTATHCLLQPYRKKWLNLLDGFLLACLNIMSCLGLESSSSSTATVVIVYMSVMGPLCLISLGIVLVRFGIMSRLSKVYAKYRQQKQINAVRSCSYSGPYIQPSRSGDREPLLQYLMDGSATD